MQRKANKQTIIQIHRQTENSIKRPLVSPVHCQGKRSNIPVQKETNLDKVTVTELKKEIDREMSERLTQTSLQYRDEVDNFVDTLISIRVKNVKIAPRMTCQKNPPVSGIAASVTDSGILTMSATVSWIFFVGETVVTEEKSLPQYLRWSTITGA